MKDYEGKINERVDSILQELGFAPYATPNCILYILKGNEVNIRLHIYDYTVVTDLPAKIWNEGGVSRSNKIKDALGF